MRQSKTTSCERIVKDIKRKTRKQYSAEEKIRIVLDGRRRELLPSVNGGVKVGHCSVGILPSRAV